MGTRVGAPRKGRRHLVNCPVCGGGRWLLARSTPELLALLSRRCNPCEQERRASLRPPPEPKPVRPTAVPATRLLAEWNASVDEVAVELLISGRPVVATRAERQEAVAVLTRRGLTSTVIAERLRVAARTVTRLRGRNREGCDA